jgi:uncharacterized membrane protein
MADEINQHPEEPNEEPVIEESVVEEPVEMENNETMEENVGLDEFPSDDITSDDKLWAALGYPIPLIALIALLLEDKKDRFFIKYHAIQSIAFNIILWIVIILLSLPTVGCISLLWLITLWPAYDAYQGKYTELPFLTNFLKKQGWVKGGA